MSGTFKFGLLQELVEECIDEGHRILLFSQFTSLLDLIEERLDEKGIERCRLDGSTRDREGEVRRFAQETRIPLFLISLKAGGFGLNLESLVGYRSWIQKLDREVVLDGKSAGGRAKQEAGAERDKVTRQGAACSQWPWIQRKTVECFRI